MPLFGPLSVARELSLPTSSQRVLVLEAEGSAPGDPVAVFLSWKFWGKLGCSRCGLGSVHLAQPVSGVVHVLGPGGVPGKRDPVVVHLLQMAAVFLALE